METAQPQSTDDLTGLGDHKAFLAAFGAALSVAQRSGEPISLAMTDIDMFKRVNDEHGRDVGDAVLKAMGRHLEGCLPDRSGVVFRYAREEFLVLMAGVEKEEAFLLLEQARAAFGPEHVFEVKGREVKLRVTFSVGIASFPEDGANVTELVRKAGDAVYRAKETGRNKVCLAREERMVTKTSHYTQGQLDRLSKLAEREGLGEAILLREALDDLLRKYSL